MDFNSSPQVSEWKSGLFFPFVFYSQTFRLFILKIHLMFAKRLPDFLVKAGMFMFRLLISQCFKTTVYAVMNCVKSGILCSII